MTPNRANPPRLNDANSGFSKCGVFMAKGIHKNLKLSVHALAQNRMHLGFSRNFMFGPLLPTRLEKKPD